MACIFCIFDMAVTADGRRAINGFIAFHRQVLANCRITTGRDVPGEGRGTIHRLIPFDMEVFFDRLGPVQLCISVNGLRSFDMRIPITCSSRPG